MEVWSASCPPFATGVRPKKVYSSGSARINSGRASWFIGWRLRQQDLVSQSWNSSHRATHSLITGGVTLILAGRVLRANQGDADSHRDARGLGWVCVHACDKRA